MDPRTAALVLHPPVSVARDFIDYPYFSDLGAVQLAAVLRELGHPVSLVDAFAIPGAALRWRADGRALLGAPVETVLAAVRTLLSKGAAPRAVVVAYSPFHRPPQRDDVLGPLLSGLRELLPSAAIVLADAYQSGQHYVEAAGAEVLASYPEAAAWVKYEAEVTVPALLAALGRASPSAAPTTAPLPPRSTRSPSPPGTSSTCPRATASAPAWWTTSGAARGPSPSTAAPSRW